MRINLMPDLLKNVHLTIILQKHFHLTTTTVLLYFNIVHM